MKRRLLVLLVVIWAFGLSGLSAPAHAQSYNIDILNSDHYPQLRDAWMFDINNKGVAAGYIATQSSQGPYLPTTYTGGGQFQTLGVQSSLYSQSVTGLNDHGVVVGNLFDPEYNQTPYIFHNGVVEYPSFPSGYYPDLLGVNNSDLAYGLNFEDLGSGAYKLDVFTLSDGNLHILPISAPGFPDIQTHTHVLSDAGLLAVTGSPQDGSVYKNFLYDIPSGTLSPVAVPDGFVLSYISQVTGSGLIFGYVATADFSRYRLCFWNADGSFRSFFDFPEGITSLRINDLGQAVGINAGQLEFFDGTRWSEREVLGLNGYTLNEISDFNDSDQFVGLADNPQHTWLWGFVATSVPEPSGVLLFGLGMGTWLGYAGLRRRRAPAD